MHEALLVLFRNRPTLAAELARDALGAKLPDLGPARVEDPTLGSLRPTELRADLVVRFEGATPVAIVVEAQLGRDADKPWSWPSYLATLRDRLRCAVILLVVTVDDAVARWCARPIETGHPGWVLTPLVVGPASVPRVTDEALAVRVPELAVLSALAHGREEDAVQIGRAALTAAARLDDERGALYADLVMTAVQGAARAALEALMANGTYEYQSEFARRYYGQGKAEGIARGKAEGLARGKAEAVLAVLAARGIVPGDELRERILACSDLATLDTWLARAVAAASAADVVGE
jgi:hypothetical protein